MLVLSLTGCIYVMNNLHSSIWRTYKVSNPQLNTILMALQMVYIQIHFLQEDSIDKCVELVPNVFFSPHCTNCFIRKRNNTGENKKVFSWIGKSMQFKVLSISPIMSHWTQSKVAHAHLLRIIFLISCLVTCHLNH